MINIDHLILNLQTMLGAGYDVIDITNADEKSAVILITTPFVDLMGDNINLYLDGTDHQLSHFQYSDHGTLLNEFVTYHDHDDVYQKVMQKLKSIQTFYHVKIDQGAIVSEGYPIDQSLNYLNFYAYLQAILDSLQTINLALNP